jgi:hypothetical protein
MVVSKVVFNMREQVWLPLLRSSGSATLGEAILRLASLAEAAHKQQTSDAYHTDDASEKGTDGPAPRDVVTAITGGRLHTEVDR